MQFGEAAGHGKIFAESRVWIGNEEDDPEMILIPKKPRISESLITDPEHFRQRRRIIRATGAAVIASTALRAIPPAAAQSGQKLPGVRKTGYRVDDDLTDYEDVLKYNNFYEFGTGKGDPAGNSAEFRTRPWAITVEGEVQKPGVIDIEEILKTQVLEERVYRLRCVEAWSMVVPWVGFPLAALLKRFEPTSKAKFVEFVTLMDPQQMPGQRVGVLDWPYREGLRIDEAVHPLTLLAVGLYGEILPNQNGAPIRLVVPWKYGFKSIKSIVTIRLRETMPQTSWNRSAPGEYGFYANVNPQVPHPRWSQKKERVIGGGLFTPKRDTELFNGYADQVGSLYSGMDLRRFY